MYTPPGTPRSRSFTRLTMRVGLLHLGQSVDFVVSITFLRSPVLAILAIGRVVLLLQCVSAHTRKKPARGFNVAATRLPLHAKILPGDGGTRSSSLHDGRTLHLAGLMRRCLSTFHSQHG